MNSSNLDSENRTVRRKEEKAKRKIIVHLVAKGKADKRTYRNLKAIFSFIGNREQFTGPQIQKNKGVKSSVLYDLLASLKERGLIVEVGKVKSAGRGETKVYSLTLAGKIVASYVNDDSKLLMSSLKEIADKEANPLRKFLIQAFMENYPSSLMREILEFSISRLKSEDGVSIDDLLSDIFEGAFLETPFFKEEDEELKEELQKIFRKNALLMEKSPYRDWIFQYFKMMLESRFLYWLEGEKLRSYAESLRGNPQLLHVPCENPKCTNVIEVDSLVKMSVPQYCGKCVKEGVKA